MSLAEKPDQTPYEDAYDLYWSAGWRSVLPLPPRRKKSPPTGYTGRAATIPSYADVYAWGETEAHGNVALRMPHDVIGLDVDDYDGKHGGETIRKLQAELGPLPPTWKSSARSGTSGIRFYRIPADPPLKWPGELPGGDVEIIQAVHRYAVVAPSIHPDTGSLYRWTDADGVDTLRYPGPDDFPELPARWIEHLTGGVEDSPVAKLQVDVVSGMGWLLTLDGFQAPEPCRVMAKTQASYSTRNGSMHEHSMKHVLRAVRQASVGHVGGLGVIGAMRAQFMQDVTAPGRGRTQAEADAEWNRLITGAIGLVQADPRPPECDCFGQLSSALVNAAPVDPVAPVSASAGSGVVEVAEAPADPVTGHTEPQEASDDPEPDAPAPTWGRIDLGPFLSGEYKPVHPTLFERTDGQALFYAEMVHSLHGESESGKSLVAQFAAADLIRWGERVLYLDFESDAASVVTRMLSLGCSREDLAERFDYRTPAMSPAAATELPAWAAMLSERYALAVVDGVTDALGVMGLSGSGGSKDNDAVSEFMRKLPRAVADRTGAAVVMIDHVAKDSETRGRFAIGGQAKMAALTGAAYTVRMSETLGYGNIGAIEMRIGKDRPGQIRPNCGHMDKSQTQAAATIRVDSTGEFTTWEVLPPAEGTEGPDSEFRPTGYMERVSRVLESSTEPMTITDVRTVVKGKASLITLAVDALVDLGHVVREVDSRRRRPLRMVRPFREDEAVDNPVDESSRSNGSAVVPMVPGTTQTSGSRPVLPYGGREPLTGVENDSSVDSGSLVDDQAVDLAIADCRRCDRRVMAATLERLGGVCVECWRAERS